MRINSCRDFPIPAAVLALTLILAPAASPDVWDKKTHVKFGEPVEFPGGVVVPPGGYVMKLLDSLSNRHIVQVLNADQNHVYATVFAIPTQRSEPADRTIITFYETPRGEPLFVHKWFYPGDTLGQEFLYPRSRTRYIARATTFSRPEADTASASSVGAESTPQEANTSGNATGPNEAGPTEQAPEPAPTPQVVQPPEPQAAPKPKPVSEDRTAPASAVEPKPATGEKLPATASIAPELALAGGLLVLMAFVLTVARRVALRSGVDPHARR